MEETEKSLKIDKKTIIINSIIVVLFIFVVYQYRDFFHEVNTLIRDMDKKIVLLICMLSFGYYALESYVCYLVGKQHHKELRYIDSLKIGYVTCFFRLLTLGTGGMPAKVYCYHKKGLEVRDATGVWIVQYVFYKVTILTLGLLSFLFFPSMMENLPVGLPIVILGISIAILVIVVLMVVAINQKMTNRLYGWIHKIKIKNEKINEKIESVFSQIQLLQDETKRIMINKKLCLYMFFVSVIMMVLYNLIPTVMIHQNSDISLWYGSNAMALTNLLSGAIPAPSGFGSIELIYYSLLTPFHISVMAAGSLVILRLFTVIVPFFIGGILWIVFSKEWK